MATIEERAEAFASRYSRSDQHFAEECYIMGATEQHNTDIEKATEWLNANWRKYIDIDVDGMIRFSGWKKDFEKAMLNN